MKKKLCLLTAAAAVMAGSHAHAQGLLSIGSRDDFEQKLPFTLTVGVGAGWDSNPGLSALNEQDSSYISGTIRADYSTGDRRTAYSFTAEYSPFFYFDAPNGMDEFMQDASIGFYVHHKATSRLQLTNNLYFAYEFQPDYNIGAVATRRNQQYLYGYNSTALSYLWTRRFSTVTSFTVSGTAYDDDYLDGEDLIAFLVAQEFRYAVSRTTTAALTYRFGVGEYDNDFGNYESHYILAGVDHAFGPRTQGSFRVGAEIRDRDYGGSATNPYFEGSFSHRVARQTNLRWYGRLGFEDAEIGNSTERYSFRTGLSADQRLAAKLGGSLGLHWIHDDYDYSNASDIVDDVLAVSVNFDYNFYRNLILNAGYSFTTLISDSDFREYDRHIVNVGLTARF